MTEHDTYQLEIEDVQSMPTRVASGLKAVCICRHGEPVGSRSAATARELSEAHHYPSVYFQGGLTALAQLSPENRDKVFGLLAYAPDLIFTIARSEYDEEYYALLHDIRLQPGKRLIIDEFVNDIVKNYLPKLK